MSNLREIVKKTGEGLEGLYNKKNLQRLGLIGLAFFYLNLSSFPPDVFADGGINPKDKCVVTPQGDIPAVNLREGPGTGYGTIGALRSGEEAEVIGYDPKTGWQFVVFSQEEGKKGWVTGSEKYTNKLGDCGDIPIVEFTPPLSSPPQTGEENNQPDNPPQEQQVSEQEIEFNEWVGSLKNKASSDEAVTVRISPSSTQQYLDFAPFDLKGLDGVVNFTGTPKDKLEQFLNFLKEPMLSLPEDMRKRIYDNVLVIRTIQDEIRTEQGEESKGIAFSSDYGGIVGLRSDVLEKLLSLKSDSVSLDSEEQKTIFLKSILIMILAHEAGHIAELKVNPKSPQHIETAVKFEREAADVFIQYYSESYGPDSNIVQAIRSVRFAEK